MPGSTAIRRPLETSRRRHVVVRVSDTGTGIAPENLEGIFGEFAQLRHSPDAEKRGLGLGRAICKRLVGMMAAELR
jgi:signal transduction histidine kinase